ncbi:Conserved hypothetical protein [Xanthomonas translucens pv. translucens DSM 18974]|uniref:Uncharacterized protein n=1 Tax=Xanthomonas translucens pv. translucens DSM 18974 TaxID=1261556 RepID=A0A1C3TMJ7_XANCT|nr:sigma-70 family RNA polymerase sigma factor [Xanthomonas translucens]MCC8446515.1 sigma-70 family RNA polymerase sigma factor [Xanthomonas translucens pv. translucens]CCP42108.1 putative protein ydfG [Xanthomonas translucens pv. translucens DSM 18974]SCB04428.1 Conserved hypothetical protein [Xanthomonas translucens pv. translucens DSM 18974]
MSLDPAFESQRPRLFGLAYRLLGSRSDTEDVLQDAWLRWQASDRAAIRDPEAWLVTTTTRLGLDRLRAVRSARVHYTGPWLPEPLEIAEDTDPAARHVRAEQVSVAFLALLERLGPDERAAFLLKEAFDYDYAQIGQLLGLVFLRVSQLNGCAYCIDMHATALRKAGIEPRKLDTLAGWGESRFFDPRERLALAWAEALTTLPSGAPPQDAYDALSAHFDEHGISALTMAIAVINAWNRLGVGLQPAMP